MAKLKIRFEQMLFLVRSASQPTVLFPKGWGKMVHDLYTDGLDPQLRFCGADLSITTSEGTKADSDTGIEWPHAGFLLDTEILRCKDGNVPRIRRALLDSETCPGELNARFHLPVGKFGWDWNMSSFGEARWQVGPSKNHNQWLTDVLTFECDISDSVDHFLAIAVANSSGGVDVHQVPLQKRRGEDIKLVLWQHDRYGHESRTPFLQRTRQLKDFEVIFDLLDCRGDLKPPQFDRIGPETSRPPGTRQPRKIRQQQTRFGACDVETAGIGEILSDTDPERPICGGAQGDPP